MKRLKLDHVERLSRGKRSGVHAGSRSVGHYLRPHERACYERALKKGYLDITEKDRANLWHIWEKACAAKGFEFFVLVKNLQNGTATIYHANQEIKTLELDKAKREIQLLASGNK